MILADREGNLITSYERCVPADVLNGLGVDVEMNDCKVCLESTPVATGSGGGSTQN
jgi:hypothetical protein